MTNTKDYILNVTTFINSKGGVILEEADGYGDLDRTDPDFELFGEFKAELKKLVDKWDPHFVSESPFHYHTNAAHVRYALMDAGGTAMMIQASEDTRCVTTTYVPPEDIIVE